MRTNVLFRHPAPFDAVAAGSDVLSARGAAWFAAMLGRLPEIEVDGAPCQEDWGVAIFLRRRGHPFWVGLGAWPDEDHTWLAHIHHGPFAWFRRRGRAGREDLGQLARDIHALLAADPAVAIVGWYREAEMRGADPTGAPTPDPTE